MAEPERKSRVFLSYARADAAFVDQLALGLEETGEFEAQIDRAGVAHGEDWRSRLSEMIRSSDSVVIALSPDWLASETCAWELEQAQRLAKRLIPVIWRPIDFAAAPPALRALNAAPFSGAEAVTGLSKLLRALRSDLAWLRRHSALTERADEWRANQRASAFLMRGGALKDARDWLAARPTAGPDPTPLQREYLQASEEEETKLLSAERARAEALARARDDAVAAQRAERVAGRRVARRTQAGLAVALALLGVAAVFAWRADHRERLAVERLKLADQSDEAAFAFSQRLRDMSARTQREAAAAAAAQAEAAQSARAAAEARAALQALRADLSGARADLSGARAELSGARAELEQARAAAGAALTTLADNRYLDAAARLALGLEALSAGASDRERRRATAAVWSVVIENTMIRDLGVRPPRAAPRLASPDGARMLAPAIGGGAIWDMRDGQAVAKLTDGAPLIESAAFSPDGARLLTVERDGTAAVWDADDGVRLTDLPGARTPFLHVAFAPDGSRVAAASAAGGARLWDATAGRVLAKLGDATVPTATAFAPGGDQVAAAAPDGVVRVWDAATGALRLALNGHGGAVSLVAFAPDGRRILTAGADGAARLWSAADGRELIALAPESGPIGVAAFSRGARSSRREGRTALRGCGTRKPGASGSRSAVIAAPSRASPFQRTTAFCSPPRTTARRGSGMRPTARRSASSRSARRTSAARFGALTGPPRRRRAGAAGAPASSPRTMRSFSPAGSSRTGASASAAGSRSCKGTRSRRRVWRASSSPPRSRPPTIMRPCGRRTSRRRAFSKNASSSGATRWRRMRAASRRAACAPGSCAICSLETPRPDGA